MTTGAINRRWTVGRPNHDPGGICLAPGHFVADAGPIPVPADGQVLIRAVYLSPDPMNHAWVRGIPGKFDALPPGAVMRGGVAGRIVASRHPDWAVGDGVTGFLDWSDFALSDGLDHMGVPLARVPAGLDLASGLSTLGMTGICAWLGLTEIGGLTPGDTVLISGASGGIGSIAGQIARKVDARTVGIAGGAEKCALVGAMGFDAVVDYKAPNLADQIAAACPSGADLFFDNVGGALLDAALVNMATGGRIVICGGTAHYGAEPMPIYNHIEIVIRSVTMRGFFYFDMADRWPNARERLSGWLRDGSIRETLDIADGFDAVPAAAIGQFTGGVRGRKLVRIADDPARAT